MDQMGIFCFLKGVLKPIISKNLTPPTPLPYKGMGILKPLSL
jgi:hypothetical protein